MNVIHIANENKQSICGSAAIPTEQDQIPIELVRRYIAYHWALNTLQKLNCEACKQLYYKMDAEYRQEEREELARLEALKPKRNIYGDII